jgi:hypothetical protein
MPIPTPILKQTKAYYAKPQLLCAPEVSVDGELKAEIDDRFDPHIEKIMRALEDQEAVLTLPRTPTKRLPN